MADQNDKNEGTEISRRAFLSVAAGVAAAPLLGGSAISASGLAASSWALSSGSSVPVLPSTIIIARP